MFVYNTFRPDVRVLKEAKSLTVAGYDVTIVALLDDNSKPYEEMYGIEIVRVERNPIHYRILQKIRNFNQQPVTPLVKLTTPPITSKQVNALEPIILPSEPQIQVAAEPLDYQNSPHKEIFNNPEKALTVPQPEPMSKINKIYNLPSRLWLKVSSLVKNKNPLVRHHINRQTKKVFTKIKKKSYQSIRSFLLSFHKPLSFIDYYEKSFNLIADKPADIYHAHDLNTLPVAWWLRNRFGGRLVYDSHELYTEMTGISKPESRRLAVAERYLIRRCDRVITVNDSIADELQKRYAIARPTILLNCPEVNQSLGKTDLLRQKLAIATDIPIILYQGGFSPKRGLENLILASRHFDRGKLIFMGWGKIEPELKELVKTKRLEEVVYFVPGVPQAELLFWTASADLGVIPYQAVGLNNYYSCPNKLFEYIAAGIPVAGSAFPEITKIVEGYGIGLTFDAEIPESIATAVNSILADESKYQEMCAQAKLARKVFNWQNQEQKLLNLYQTLKPS